MVSNLNVTFGGSGFWLGKPFLGHYSPASWRRRIGKLEPSSCHLNESSHRRLQPLFQAPSRREGWSSRCSTRSPSSKYPSRHTTAAAGYHRRSQLTTAGTGPGNKAECLSLVGIGLPMGGPGGHGIAFVHFVVLCLNGKEYSCFPLLQQPWKKFASCHVKVQMDG